MTTSCPVCRALVMARSKWTKDPIGFQELYECGALYWWGEEARVLWRCGGTPSPKPAGAAWPS